MFMKDQAEKADRKSGILQIDIKRLNLEGLIIYLSGLVVYGLGAKTFLMNRFLHRHTYSRCPRSPCRDALDSQ